MASTAARPLVLPPPTACLVGSDDETNIPVALLRAPCDLEILIPARNEAQRLPNTLARTVRYLEAQPYSSSVVVVDNGSVDQTADLAARKWSERVPVHLAGCARPGKGAAVRRGLLTSRARFVGYMDADLATPIETLDMVMPLLGVARRRGLAAGRRCGLRQAPARYRSSAGWCSGPWPSGSCPASPIPSAGSSSSPVTWRAAVARRLRIDGFAFDVELLRAVADWASGEGGPGGLVGRGGIDAARDHRRHACRRGRAAPGPPEDG